MAELAGVWAGRGGGGGGGEVRVGGGGRSLARESITNVRG